MANDTTDLNEFLGAPQRPWWRRYLLWIGLGGVIVIVAVVAFLLLGRSKKVEYALADVDRGTLTVTVSATGKLAPTHQVQVGSETSGIVQTLLVEANDRVVKDQPLAILDPSRLDDAVTQSVAQVNANKAAVAQQQATLQQDRAQLARLQQVYKLSGGRVPAKTDLDTAEATLARDIANIHAADANVVSSQAALRSNQTSRYKAVIRSPVNGVVLARQVDQGQTVAASFSTPTMFVIAEDLTKMQLQVAIDEADVGEVKAGQSATFTVDAFPGRSFPAKIIRVDLGSNLAAQSSSSSSTSSTSTSTQVVSYAATLSVANPDLTLRPGMTATAVITTSSQENVVLVPNAALRFNPTAQPAASPGFTMSFGPPRGAGASKSATIARGARQRVYVVGPDGSPKPISVITGSSNGSMTEVTGGDLRPGMKVITGQLAAGAKSQASGGQRAGGQ